MPPRADAGVMCVIDAVLGLAIRDTASSSETSRIVLPEGERLQLSLDSEPHPLYLGDGTLDIGVRKKRTRVN
jgi:hypothetical protein